MSALETAIAVLIAALLLILVVGGFVGILRHFLDGRYAPKDEVWERLIEGNHQLTEEEQWEQVQALLESRDMKNGDATILRFPTERTKPQSEENGDSNASS